MYSRILLLDGYLDEPSTLGVPPYISPLSRYLYGLLLDTGYLEESISYVTIDELRKNKAILSQSLWDLVIILAGTPVPGHYLGGKPISLKEIKDLIPLIKGESILVGPISECGFTVKGITYQAPERCLTYLYKLLTGKTYPLSYQKGIAQWSIPGALLTLRHPSFPYLICELETFRGCLRDVHCRFCSEGYKENTYTRSPEEIIEEVLALYQAGNRYFRLGSQTDLILYGALKRRGLYPMPRPSFLLTLYQGIKEVAPRLKVLHMDNGGPRSLLIDEKKGEEILHIITSYNTPGDVMAMGLESVDPEVLKANAIGTTSEETFQAIKLVNRIGGIRVGGIPLLLPGINLLFGLQGERRKTYEYNYHFLKNILDEGLLLRRINIRQVRSIHGYEKTKTMSSYQFQEYKNRINEEINQPLLERAFPFGTILKEVLLEKRKGNLTFGRQLGSYPLLVGIPGIHPLGEVRDVIIVDHGFRSVTALPYPFYLNKASWHELSHLPGIGKKRAFRLQQHRPFQSWEEVSFALDHEYPLERLSSFCKLQDSAEIHFS